MDTSCEHYEECGLDYCMYGVECPEYKEKIQGRDMEMTDPMEINSWTRGHESREGVKENE